MDHMKSTWSDDPWWTQRCNADEDVIKPKSLDNEIILNSSINLKSPQTNSIRQKGTFFMLSRNSIVYENSRHTRKFINFPNNHEIPNKFRSFNFVEFFPDPIKSEPV